MRRMIIGLSLVLPALALAQGAPAGQPAQQPAQAQPPVHTNAPAATSPGSAPAASATATTEAAEVKHDQGTVHTVDAQRGLVICDMPDGPVTYDVGSAQLFDLAGMPQGTAAAGVKVGDKVRITYTVQNGAHATEVRVVK